MKANATSIGLNKLFLYPKFGLSNIHHEILFQTDIIIYRNIYYFFPIKLVIDHLVKTKNSIFTGSLSSGPINKHVIGYHFTA